MTDGPILRARGGSLTPDPVSQVRRYAIALCDLCIAGTGGECHSPRCALWLNRAPDIPVHVSDYGMCVPFDEAVRQEIDASARPIEEVIADLASRVPAKNWARLPDGLTDTDPVAPQEHEGEGETR